MTTRSLALAASVVVVLVALCVSSLTFAVSSGASALFGQTQGRVKVVVYKNLAEADADNGAGALFATTTSTGANDDDAKHGAVASSLVPLGLANGSRYQCHVPARVSTDESDRMWRAHLQTVRDHAVARHHVRDLHRALRGLCFTHPAGWWSYKLCWNRDLKQFHADASGKVEAEYFLGRGPEAHVEDGASDTLFYDVDPANPTRARLVAEWFNGTECDLTAEQRRMQLLLVCSEGNRASTDSKHLAAHEMGELVVVEPSSCEYQVTLKHPAFCQIPELRTRERPETIVKCLDVTPSEPDASKSISDGSSVHSIDGETVTDDAAGASVPSGGGGGGGANDEEEMLPAVDDGNN